jgi:hypothetical protein
MRNIPPNKETVAQFASLIKRSRPVFLRKIGMSEEHISPLPRRGRSPTVTRDMAIQMHRMRERGIAQHHIAAYFGVNQGRVCEVLKGDRFPDLNPQNRLF